MFRHCAFIIFALLGVGAKVVPEGKAPLIELNDGNKMPSFGLGTWLSNPDPKIPFEVAAEAVEKAVEIAIDAGYRHIDTAFIYSTEKQVGQAVNKKISEGVITRENIFITTKLWNDRHAKDDVVPALKEALARLNLTYVDLYLIHWPISTHVSIVVGSPDGKVCSRCQKWDREMPVEPRDEQEELEKKCRDFVLNDTIETDYLDTWKGMIEAQKLGLTKSIGVSNFNEAFLQRLIDESSVKPAVLQVEINLNLQQPKLLEYCRNQNITVMAYTPFGSIFGARNLMSSSEAPAPPPRYSDPELQNLAKKYKKTVAQVVLRYLYELGIVPIPKSVTKERIQENIQIFDFTLAQQDKEQLKRYDVHFRTINPKWWNKSPYYPFEKQ